MNSALIYFLDRYPCWSETFIRQDIEMLRELGLAFTLVARNPGDCEPQPEWPEARYLSTTDPESVAGPETPGRYSNGLLRLLPRRIRRQLSLVRHRAVLDALCG